MSINAIYKMLVDLVASNMLKFVAVWNYIFEKVAHSIAFLRLNLRLGSLPPWANPQKDPGSDTPGCVRNFPDNFPLRPH